MPNVSNEDLMKLIYRVIKKVDILEGKLDVLIQERSERPPEPGELKIVDPEFSFTPIANDQELQLVTQKIQQEDNYKENLRNFIANQKLFTLEAIFKADYLKLYTYYGVKGMKKLEGLVVYEQIYVYLNSSEGLPRSGIRLKAMRDIERVKKRFMARNRNEKHDQVSVPTENEEDEREPPLKIKKIEENVSMDSDIDDLYQDTVQSKPEEVFIEESVYEEVDHEDKADHEDTDDDESDDDGVNVHPIQKDAKLESVSQSERPPKPMQIRFVHKRTLLRPGRAKQEIEKVKTRFMSQIRNERQALSLVDNPTTTEDVTIENQQKPSRKIQKAAENDSMDSDEDNSDTMEPELGHENSEDDDDMDNDKSDLNFHPIENDAELRNVTRKIQRNPEFLKELRIRSVDESEDGQCRLTQVFSERFLADCTLFGKLKHKKLISMVPFKEVYWYLKCHFGLSGEDIERDAMVELEKVKKRVRNQRIKEKSEKVQK